MLLSLDNIKRFVVTIIPNVLTKKLLINLIKYGSGYILGDFSPKASGHPDYPPPSLHSLLSENNAETLSDEVSRI
jgi:hypothetical protein